jgi:hypothetical protein
MLRWLVTFAAVCALSSAASAGEPFGVGAIRVGMSLDEVKAAAPKAKWTQTGKREIFAEQVVAFGGETFDVIYKVEPWGRAVATFSVDDSFRAGIGGDCETRFLALVEVVEMQFGALEPALPGLSYMADDKREVGKRSTVHFVRDPARPIPFEARGRYVSGDDSMTVTGTKRSPDADRCNLGIVLRHTPPRPAEGAVPFADLVFTAQPSISVRYHSLHGLPPVPGDGIVVPVRCKIVNEEKLTGCFATDVPSAAEAYRGAAVVQAGHMKVADQTRDGNWTEGELAQIDVRLAPRETAVLLTPVPPSAEKPPAVKTPAKPRKALPHLVPATDMPGNIPMKMAPPAPPPHSPQDPSGLVFTQNPRHMDLSRVFPPRAQDKEVEAVVDMDCVVQTDYSAICPRMTVATNEKNEFTAEFEHAAGKIAMLFRVRETMVDGRNAAGAGFRRKIRFVLR